MGVVYTHKYKQRSLNLTGFKNLSGLIRDIQKKAAKIVLLHKFFHKR